MNEWTNNVKFNQVDSRIPNPDIDEIERIMDQPMFYSKLTLLNKKNWEWIKVIKNKKWDQQNRKNRKTGRIEKKKGKIETVSTIFHFRQYIYRII